MNSFNKSTLYEFYHVDKLSLKEIADKTGSSVHKVNYWMKKWSIPKRDISDAVYFKYHKNSSPFKVKDLINKKDLGLFYLGVGLFLGEGTKKNKYNVKLANSDPRIINVFINFLVNICGVQRNKIKAELNIFDDLNTDMTVKFWSKEIIIPVENFRLSAVRRSKIGSYKNKSQIGTITIYFSNVKLKNIIDEWCAKVLQNFN